MRLPSIVLLIVLALILVFAAANWAAISSPTTVSLLVTSIQAPLGLIMIGITIVVTALFLAFLVYLQTSILLDARRHSRELQAQRDLADKAEASRFTELRNHLDIEFRKLADRTDQVERGLRSSMEQTGNSLAAYIGELEDRLQAVPAETRRS